MYLSTNNIAIRYFHDAATVFNTRDENLESSIMAAPLRGHVLEFGVRKGATINKLANWVPGDRVVTGFDSFEGLPEDLQLTKSGKVAKAGKFAFKGKLRLASNVKIIKGLFKYTLPIWMVENKEPISFIHNDSDLYSSTIQTLSVLNDRIIPGTVIVFDELCNFEDSEWDYDNWEEGEWKALTEWMRVYSRKIMILSRSRHEQATIRIVE